jgi:peptidoglycan/LPS O-acetylase OafA/YrhL
MKTGLPVLNPIRGTLYAMFFGALTLMSVRDAKHSLVALAFQSSWLRTFGKYSYGLYVYHGILSQHMLELRAQDRLEALLGSNSLAIAAQTVFGVGVSLLVAAVSYEVFEKRFLALKRFFEPREAARAPSRPLAVAASGAAGAPGAAAAPGVVDPAGRLE